MRKYYVFFLNYIFFSYTYLIISSQLRIWYLDIKN